MDAIGIYEKSISKRNVSILVLHNKNGITPEETIAKAEDKEMIKTFLDTKKANEKLSLTFSNKAIDSNRVIVPFSNAKIFGQARSLCANIDSSNDEIATTYKKAVEGRGNYYTVYSGTINMAILTAINGQLSTVNEYKDTISIAKGEYKPKADEPKVWFESIKSLAQILSNENQDLLKIIDEKHPRTNVTLKMIGSWCIS